jgi:methylated-DNA-[protein]-cysteine S-methyltransferase
MAGTIRTHAFRSRLGRIWLAATDDGICAISLGNKPDERVLRRIAALARMRLRRDPEGLAAAAGQFGEYFDGLRRTFDLPLDLRGTSVFQRRIWEIVQEIEFGRRRSYKWVAEAYGGAEYAHAVGSALRTNPFPIVIPCHRIVNDDMTLGGYTGGRRWKERLLALESSQLPLEFGEEVPE